MSSNTVKRVISNPDEMDRSSKISKTTPYDEQSLSDITPEVKDTAVVDIDDHGDEEEEDDVEVATNLISSSLHLVEDETKLAKTMMDPEIKSDESSNRVDDAVASTTRHTIRTTSATTEAAVVTAVTTASKAPDTTEGEVKKNAHTMQREVSNDNCTTNPQNESGDMENTTNNTSHNNDHPDDSTTSSVSRNSSGTAPGNWGWFENVHDEHDGVGMIPNMNNNGDSGDEDLKSDSGKENDNGAENNEKSSASVDGKSGGGTKTKSNTNGDVTADGNGKNTSEGDDNKASDGKKGTSSTPDQDLDKKMPGNNDGSSRQATTSSTDKKRRKKKTPGGLLNFEPVNPLKTNTKGKKAEETSMAVTAPNYVLEESISSQKLWKHTAGNRPPQPVEERAFYEKMWAQNFARSQVLYQMPTDVLTATSPIALSPFADGNFNSPPQQLQQQGGTDYSNGSGGGDGGGGGGGAVGNQKGTLSNEASQRVSTDVGSGGGVPGVFGQSHANNIKSHGPYNPYNHHHTVVNKTVKAKGEDGTDDELTVVVRGDNVFGTTVSKSFQVSDETIVSVSISVASYRVVESKKHGKYAQYLVIFREGTFRDTVGVWKRYSDFDKLSRKVTQDHEGCKSYLAGMTPLSITEDSHEILPNAMTSWKLLKKRQRWYRCLDAGYLSLKVFLLERFLHDILFESSTPDILRDFLF